MEIDLVIKNYRSDFAVEERLIQYNDPVDPSTQSLNFETGTILLYRGNTRIDFADVFPLLRAFANTLYIGPFRNIINVVNERPGAMLTVDRVSMEASPLRR